MKLIFERSSGSYCVGVGFVNGRYIRWYPYSSNCNRKKYYKNVCNRKVRRMKGDFNLNRGQYKKMFDLWWTLF